jgi:hypothetical protein
MNNVKIFMIQQQLREGVFISIPRIQQTYGLTYSQGKRFLQNLMDRGWVDEKPIGIRYRICKGMLKLRKIQKDEVVDLVDAITSDAATALMVIVQGNGVDFDDVEEKVRGREDTRKALELLVNKDLAYCHKERYYPCVSGRTARVLENVAAEKAHMETRNRILKKEMDISALLEMFRVLFEDA